MNAHAAPPAPAVEIDDVIRAVSEHFGIAPAHLRGSATEVTFGPRKIIYFLSRRHGASWQEISRTLGRAHHTTALQGAARVEERMQGDHDFARLIDGLDVAARAVAMLRRDGKLREPHNAIDLARRVLAEDDRYAMRLQVRDIRALARELLRFYERAGRPAIFSEACADLVHDLLGVEALLRRGWSIDAAKQRNRLVLALRDHAGVDVVAELIAAFDADPNAILLRQAEPTPRYMQALSALALTWKDAMQ